MVKMIDLIEEYCEHYRYPCERLDGRVSGNDRQKAIDRYNKEPDSFIFMLSTRAGGVGINLTAADTVIIFDSDWNPQNDIQAMARCHRIGQKKHVTIYRLITRRSFEAEMFTRASRKLGLEQAVLGTRNFTEIDADENANNSSKVDAKEMEQLLREGAYAVLLEDDTEAIKEFCEQDIDKILESRTHVLVTEGNAQTESWLNKRKKSGKTSKRMFTGDSAMEHAEIDVDDPDFWKKVLPDLVTPDTMLDRLDDEDMVDDGENRDVIEKFMKDMSQMMDGMLDLNRRNQLPDRERSICMKLLLKMTLKQDVFDENEKAQASKWYSLMEGTRSRRGRQELYQVEDHRFSKSKDSNKKRRGGKGGRKSSGGRSRLSDDEIDNDDDDEDGVEDSDDYVDEFKKRKSTSRSSRGSVGGKRSYTRRKSLDDDVEVAQPVKKRKYVRKQQTPEQQAAKPKKSRRTSRYMID